MHESQLAKDLVSVVLERAGGARVLSVSGSIAETEALRPEALEFHFRAHARGTPAEAAVLALELVHVQARCNACGREYLPDHHLTLCPACASTDAVLLQPTGVSIDSIEVE